MPVVTYAGAEGDTFVVNAYVPVVDAYGSCVLDVTSGGRSARAEVPAVPDATTTWCDPLEIAVSALGSGTWAYEVSFVSAAHAGTSAPVAVQVP